MIKVFRPKDSTRFNIKHINRFGRDTITTFTKKEMFESNLADFLSSVLKNEKKFEKSRERVAYSRLKAKQIFPRIDNLKLGSSTSIKLI